MRDVVDEQQVPWRSASRGERGELVGAVGTVPYGLTGSTRQIARVRGVIAAATRSGSSAIAGAGPERDRHRPAARGDDRRRQVEVARVADG